MVELNPSIPRACTAIDLGCGPNKVANAFGVDKHPYPGVNQVMDLNVFPWPLPSNRFQEIHARHVIEHVADIAELMKEIHRIANDRALVYLVTPHFSSIDSWLDPTHCRHLACNWHTIFTQEYLAAQVAPFEHVSTELTFAGSIRTMLGRAIVRLKGRDWWERHYAFTYPARNIFTTLQVRKT